MADEPKTYLTPEEIEYFRKILLARRREVVGDVENLDAEASREAPSGADPTQPSQSTPGSEVVERHLSRGLARMESNLLWAIDHALERIEKGTYGICEVSGEPIPKERLEAKPWARDTVEVARQKEEEERGLS